MIHSRSALLPPAATLMHFKGGGGGGVGSGGGVGGTAADAADVSSKSAAADFFELVAASPDLTDAQYKQQMRSVNALFVNGSSGGGGGNPLLSGEPRLHHHLHNHHNHHHHNNNNHHDQQQQQQQQQQQHSSPGPLQSFDSIWNADRDRDRLESALLDDLNKIYWTQDHHHHHPHDVHQGDELGKGGGGGGGAGDTDGHIYTLTVLDGEAPPAPCPGDDGSAADLQTCDLDSILNIMPNQMNGFSDAFLASASPVVSAIKEEPPFSFDDVKEPIGDNNNDWKLADQNGESLLRSALQGRAQRYALVPRASPPPVAQPQIQQTQVTGDAFEQSGGQTVDEILLSQLEGAYSDEYASEIVSVQTFCPEDPEGQVVYSIQQIGNSGIVSLLPSNAQQQQQPQPQQQTSPAVVSSTKGVTKKYKRSQAKSQQQQQNAAVVSNGTGNGPQATSTSNGVRKERSLHYCSICSKGFKDKYSVNVHIRTHTGEKPFACSLCGKSFRQKAHLAKHYQTHIAQKNAAANGQAKASNKHR